MYIYSPRIPRARTPKDSSSISYMTQYMSIRPISNRLPTVPSQFESFILPLGKDSRLTILGRIPATQRYGWRTTRAPKHRKRR
jgi:hypothetical protein